MCESRRDGRCSCCERGVLGGEGDEFSVDCVGVRWVGQVADGRRGSCLKAVLQAVGSWVGEAHPTQLERQGICQLPGDWVVLGDGVLIDDRNGLAIMPEGGTGMWGRVPP